MRPVLAFLIWVAFIGGLAAYMHTRETTARVGAVELRSAVGSYSLEITPTFDVEQDPFALRTDDGTSDSTLVVRVNGKDVLKRSDRVEKGAPIRVEPLTGLVDGSNEIYLEATPPIELSGRSLALRVRLFKDGAEFADRTFWTEGGSKIATAFPVKIEPDGTSGKDQHDH